MQVTEGLGFERLVWWFWWNRWVFTSLEQSGNINPM